MTTTRTASLSSVLTSMYKKKCLFSAAGVRHHESHTKLTFGWCWKQPNLYISKSDSISLKRKMSCGKAEQSFYLLLRCTGALQGSPRNLLGFKGAVGGSLFTAISHGRIGDVVQTSHTQGKETVQWRHLYVASDCLNPAKTQLTNSESRF